MSMGFYPIPQNRRKKWQVNPTSEKKSPNPSGKCVVPWRPWIFNFEPYLCKKAIIFPSWDQKKETLKLLDTTDTTLLGF
jgi:hypothetical protein